MFDRRHVAAIFASHADAESAVDELRRAGIADEHLGVAVHDPDVSVVMEEEEDAEAEHAATRAVAFGGVIGVVAGITVMAIASTITGGIGVGGLLAGGIGGLLGGAAIGGEVGLSSEEPALRSVEHLRDLALEPGQVLVVAKAHHRREAVEAAMRRHGGHLVDSGEAGPQGDDAG